MAIDDNTVYGLTGAQVKELPEKIEAVKGLARELTADDYNYPVDNPTYIALWKLEPGMYYIPYELRSNVRGYNNDRDGNWTGVVLIGYTSRTTEMSIVSLGYRLANFSSTNFINVNSTSGDLYTSGRTLLTNNLVNNLTSTDTKSPLSAAQGKALKDLIDAIQVPTKTSDLTNDSNFVTLTEMTTALAGKADTNDIPTALSELTNDINAVSDANYVHTDNNYTTVEKNKLAGIAAGAEANVQANWNETDATSDAYIQNKPSLASVATSGSYADLTNKPTIPVVNNAALTIQRNGVTLGAFTANSSTETTVNIEVPTVFTTNEWNALWA